MALMYTKTRDQALLGFVVKEGSEIARKTGGWLGRTAVQKIMYFLGVRGVDINYKFDIYQYGPFSEQILWDIDYLLADGIIQEKSTNPEKFSNYGPSDANAELFSLYADDIKSAELAIKELVETLVPMKPSELELVSTLDYIYREQLATGKKSDLKDEVVARFQDIKKDKFTIDQVTKAYDSMVSASLFKG
ncbi:MAG: hypothetical protein AB7Q37_18440 [Pyrinomonadaceae bacterium]